MKSSITSALSLGFTLSTAALAQQAAAPAKSESVLAGEALLKKVARTYAEAAALSDTITLDLNTANGPQKQQLTIRLQGDDLSLVAPGLDMTVIKNTMYVQNPDSPDVYVEFAVAGDLAEAVLTTIPYVPPHLLMRSAFDPVQHGQAWTFGLLTEPQIIGHAIKTIDGVEMHEIALKSAVGFGNLLVNPRTHMVQKAFVHVAPPGGPEDSEMTGTLTLTPVISQTLEPAIAFDPAGKEKVASLAHLAPNLRNKPAPDFTLQTLDGSTIHLADLKGRVVVLDFWATWCGPCKRGLPLLQKFADWVKAEGKPVKVYAVDTMENGAPDESQLAVAEYWTSQNFTIPTLLDPNRTLPGPYMIQSIPLTLVLDAEGIVRKVHLGFDPEMVEKLQRDVTALLDAAGQ